MSNFSYQKFIQRLVELSPRQLDGERKAADLIMDTLKELGINFKEQWFRTFVPFPVKSYLRADKKEIPAQSTSIIGGEIHGKDSLISSLTPSSDFIDTSNINFNPKCKAISANNFYFAPSVAIKPEDVPLVIRAKEVYGEVQVKKTENKAVNILAGNTVSPQNICFAHYDSINTGAVDDASGVSLLMRALADAPSVLEDDLFVFAANEELSYDKPTYWGKGYREFEKEYASILREAENIIIVECIGNGPANVIENDSKIGFLAFPVNMINSLQNKLKVLTGDYEELMTVYHSNLDTPEQVKDKYFQDSYKKFKQLLA